MLTDEYKDGWLEQLDSWADSVSSGQYVHILVDGAFVPGLRRQVARALGDDASYLLFESRPSCTDEVRDVSPVLFSYRSRDDAVGKVLSRCSGWPMLSAVVTREPLRDLANRLSPWCIVENDGQRFNFRFPDTRRLPCILSVLATDQMATFAGPATSWKYIRRDGTWGSVDLVGYECDLSTDTPVLTDGQFGSLVADSEIDELIAQLRYSNIGVSLSPYSLYSAVQRGIASAESRISGQSLFDWLGSYIQSGAPEDLVRARSMYQDWTLTSGG
jgi:hypothetical protein